MKTVTFTGNKPQLTVWRSNNQKSPEQDDHPHALAYQPAPAATHEEPPVLYPIPFQQIIRAGQDGCMGQSVPRKAESCTERSSCSDSFTIFYLSAISNLYQIFSCVDFIKHVTLQLSSEKSCPVHQIYENRSAEADFQWLCMSPSVPLKNRPTQDLAEDCSHVQLDVHAQCKATQCSSRSPV